MKMVQDIVSPSTNGMDSFIVKALEPVGPEERAYRNLSCKESLEADAIISGTALSPAAICHVAQLAVCDAHLRPSIAHTKPFRLPT